MDDKYIENKIYRVVCKSGSHLNTKKNPDGSISALQFTNESNELSGPVDLIEVDEEDLIRTEYIRGPRDERPWGERFIDEVVIPIIRNTSTQLLEYGTQKAEEWIEEKVAPAAKAKAKSGLENLKLFISTLKDVNKPIKASQIIDEQQRKSLLKKDEIEDANKVRHPQNKKYTLSVNEVKYLLDVTRQSALMIAASLSILNDSVVTDDGTDSEKIAMIQREIEQLSSKEITTQIDLLLEEKNNGLIDEDSIAMLQAFRNGFFIGKDKLIPVSRYNEEEKEERRIDSI